MRTQRCIALVSAILTVICGSAAFGQGQHYWQFEENGTHPQSVRSTAQLTYRDGTRSTDIAVNPVPNPDDGPFSDSSDPKDNTYSIENPRVERGPTSVLMMRGTQSWTLEGWFKLSDTPSHAGAHFMLATTMSGEAGHLDGWRLLLNSENDRLYVQMYGPYPTDLVTHVSTTVFSTNIWYHFAFLYDHDDGEDGSVKLYINGKLDTGGSGVANNDLHAAGGSRYFSFGCAETSTSAFNYDDYPLPGFIDEWRLSLGLLTPSQFLNDAPPKGTILVID